MATKGDQRLSDLRDQRHEGLSQRIGYRPPAPGRLPAKPRPKLAPRR